MTLKVFPALPMVMVLSHIPGREAGRENSITTLGKNLSMFFFKKTKTKHGQLLPNSGLSPLHQTLRWERTDFDVLVAPVDEPLVNLVAEAQSVVFDAEVGDHLQLVPGEHLQEEDRS